MSIVSKVTAFGTPGVVAAGAALIWGQSALVWVTQPSHLLPVAAITAVSATVMAKHKGKVEEATVEPSAVDDRIAQLAAQLERRALLPVQDRGQVIDWTAAQERRTV